MDNNDVVCTCLDLTIGDIKKAIEDGATTFEELPAAAQAYVNRIEELTGVPVKIVAVGPRRDQTIIRGDLFA